MEADELFGLKMMTSCPKALGRVSKKVHSNVIETIFFLVEASQGWQMLRYGRPTSTILGVWVRFLMHVEVEIGAMVRFFGDVMNVWPPKNEFVLFLRIR